MATVDTIRLTDSITACEQNIVSDMGGEKVMLSVRNGNYYNLGQIGGHIWDAVAGGLPVARLIDRLCSEYDVTSSECEQQVMAFLEQLRKEGLIYVHPKSEDAVHA
jgi:hypothetical protein